MDNQNGAPAEPGASPRERIDTIRSALCATFREREDAVEALLLGALTHQHVALLGPPGTGKSAVVRALMACIQGAGLGEHAVGQDETADARYFDTLLSRFTTEDEVCGPVKLSALKADKIERATDGMLPDVHCAFLDEVFNANDSCLLSLNSVLNERLYRGQRCPLRFAVGASNVTPEQSASLDALWDRFLLRSVVGYIVSDATWVSVLKARPSFVPPCTITLAEWDAAVAAVEALPIPDPVYAQLVTLKRALEADGVTVSDRRWIQCTGVLRAAAWLEGDSEVAVDHLGALRFCLWFAPEQRDKVDAVLAAVDRSAVRRALDAIDTALRAYANRPVDRADYHRALPELADLVLTTAKTVKGMAADGLSKSAQRRLAPRLGELRETYAKLQADLAQRYAM